jgi:hypothetical protein
MMNQERRNVCFILELRNRRRQLGIEIILKTRYRPRPFQGDQLCEDRSLGIRIGDLGGQLTNMSSKSFEIGSFRPLSGSFFNSSKPDFFGWILLWKVHYNCRSLTVRDCLHSCIRYGHVTDLMVNYVSKWKSQFLHGKTSFFFKQTQ